MFRYNIDNEIFSSTKKANFFYESFYFNFSAREQKKIFCDKKNLPSFSKKNKIFDKFFEMAIPFFEPHDTETTVQQNGDQVDGHGGTPASTITATATSVGNSAITADALPSDNEQVLAWKILAIAMCKALKDYYEQSPSTQEAFTSANGNIVQVLPNGEVHPFWK